MSAQEIIAELGKLNADELGMVRRRLDALVAAASQSREGGSKNGIAAAGGDKKAVPGFLLRVAGSVKGLPADMAQNHDHYLYGTPKKALA